MSLALLLIIPQRPAWHSSQTFLQGQEVLSTPASFVRVWNCVTQISVAHSGRPAQNPHSKTLQPQRELPPAIQKYVYWCSHKCLLSSRSASAKHRVTPLLSQQRRWVPTQHPHHSLGGLASFSVRHQHSWQHDQGHSSSKCSGRGQPGSAAHVAALRHGQDEPIRTGLWSRLWAGSILQVGLDSTDWHSGSRLTHPAPGVDHPRLPLWLLPCRPGAGAARWGPGGSCRHTTPPATWPGQQQTVLALTQPCCTATRTHMAHNLLCMQPKPQLLLSQCAMHLPVTGVMVGAAYMPDEHQYLCFHAHPCMTSTPHADPFDCLLIFIITQHRSCTGHTPRCHWGGRGGGGF